MLCATRPLKVKYITNLTKFTNLLPSLSFDFVKFLLKLSFYHLSALLGQRTNVNLEISAFKLRLVGSLELSRKVQSSQKFKINFKQKGVKTGLEVAAGL